MSCARRLRRSLVVASVAAALAGLHGPAWGATEQVPGKLLIIKSGKLAKFVSKPDVPVSLPAPTGAADPTLVDATFSISDEGDNARTFFANLVSEQWQGLGSPDGAKGYKYKGAGTPSDPCKIVILKNNVIKAVCKDDQLLDPPLVGAAAVKLRTGPLSYAARFTVPTKNQGGLYKASSAPACTPPGTCCGGMGFHAFTTANAGGDCGDLRDTAGNNAMVGGDLTCSGLYFGGGGNSVPLPLSFPGQEQTITALTSCTGQSATLGAATSVDTGSNRNCSGTGCLFGPPVPLPNALSTPTSTCIVFSVSGAVSGSLDCDTGSQDLSLPLGATVFLTGDSAADPGNSIPGIQTCPMCSAGSCIGGPNNGMVCVPATGDGTTTHDCPPDPFYNIGTVPLAFALSSGTVSWRGSVATNDTGNTVSTQNRVFSGYCRDADGTGCFAGDPHVLCPVAAGPQKCWENGMAVGPACAGAHESCEQRNNGAFGPGGGATLTITAFGQPQDGLFCGNSTGVLASVFGIAPTYNATVDAAADFPGPGAVTIPVVGALCGTATTCPLSGP